MSWLKSFLDGFYLIPNSDRPKWPIEGGFLVEIEEPYRRGRGLVFKGFRGQYQLGWGRPGSNPLPPLDVTPEEIGSWNPPPEIPPYPLSPPADGLLYELLYPGAKMVYHLSYDFGDPCWLPFLDTSGCTEDARRFLQPPEVGQVAPEGAAEGPPAPDEGEAQEARLPPGQFGA